VIHAPHGNAGGVTYDVVKVSMHAFREDCSCRFLFDDMERPVCCEFATRGVLAVSVGYLIIEGFPPTVGGNTNTRAGPKTQEKENCEDLRRKAT
jgi:hypothetical protein